jgi:solute carrier family 45, member 1/2/4
MSATLWLAGEEQKQLDKDDVDASGGACSAFVDLFKCLKNLPPAMFSVLAVTAVTWVRAYYYTIRRTRAVLSLSTYIYL